MDVCISKSTCNKENTELHPSKTHFSFYYSVNGTTNHPLTGVLHQKSPHLLDLLSPTTSNQSPRLANTTSYIPWSHLLLSLHCYSMSLSHCYFSSPNWWWWWLTSLPLYLWSYSQMDSSKTQTWFLSLFLWKPFEVSIVLRIKSKLLT